MVGTGRPRLWATAAATALACGCGRVSFEPHSAPGLGDAGSTDGAAGTTDASPGPLAIELDPPVALTERAWGAADPSAVVHSAGLAVAWIECDAGTCRPVLQRFDLDGAPLGAELVLPSVAGNLQDPHLASNGSTLAMTWQRATAGNQEHIDVALFDQVGALVAGPTALSDGAGAVDSPKATWAGSDLIVSWDDDGSGPRQLLVTRLDETGDVVTQPTVVNTGLASQPNDPFPLYTSRGDLWLAWQDFRDGSEIWLASLDLAALAVSGELPVTDSTVPSRDPNLTDNGSELLLTFSDDRSGDQEAYWQRITHDGLLVGPPVQISSVAGPSNAPNAATAGGLSLVAWTEGDFKTRDAYLVGIVGDQVDEPFLVADGSCRSKAVVVASATGGALIWDDERGARTQLYLARIRYLY